MRNVESYLKIENVLGKTQNYIHSVKMNNTYDKRLIVKSIRYEENGTEDRKYLEEDGETGLMKVITEGEFVMKHKKYGMENCITDKRGKMLEIRKEVYQKEKRIKGRK